MAKVITEPQKRKGSYNGANGIKPKRGHCQKLQDEDDTKELAVPRPLNGRKVQNGKKIEVSFDRIQLLDKVEEFSSPHIVVVDVSIDDSEKRVEVRYYVNRRTTKPASEVRVLREMLEPCLGAYKLGIKPIQEIPIIESTRRPGIGSRIVDVDKCVTVFTHGNRQRILTSGHGLTLGQPVQIEGEIHDPNCGTDHRINGKVETIVHREDAENYGNRQTVDAALIELDQDRDPSLSHFCQMNPPTLLDLSQTVNQAGKERGIGSEIEDAVLNRIVVKVCNQQSNVLGKIVDLDRNFICEAAGPRLYKCIVIELFSGDTLAFHEPGESGMLISYEPVPPLPYTLKAVAMLIGRVKEGGKWYSLAVPIQRTFGRLGARIGTRVQLMHTIYNLDTETGMYDVPPEILL